MDFLALCQRTVLESGISETGPSSVTGQTSDLLRIVNWVNDAWFELQASRNQWKWMLKSTEVPVVIGKHKYQLPSDVKNTLSDTLCLNGQRLYELPIPAHNCNDNLPTSRPTGYYLNYKDEIVLSSIPDQNYTLSFEYFCKPELLKENLSTPDMPEEYHMIIVWAALKEYAMYDEAPELYQKGENNFTKILTRLENNMLPSLQLAGPLA